MKTFGKTISDRRKELKISQKDLAARIKKEDGEQITPQYLNDIEHDRRNPPGEQLLIQFAKELNLEIEILFLLAGTVPKQLQEHAQNASSKEQERLVKLFRRTLK